MNFIEIKLIGGERLSIRKDAIISVREFKYISKEMVKELPFLRERSECVAIVLPDRNSIYSEDSYDSITEKLK